MTTRTEQIPAFSAPVATFPWRRLALSFALTLAAVLVFAAAFMVGYASFHAGKVLPGVSVGGVALAGLDRPAAEAALREQLPRLGDGHVSLRLADVQTRIGYSEIGRDYDMGAMLDQAFAVGRNGSIVEQAQEQLRVLLNGVSLQPQAGWDADALAARLSALAEDAYIAPVDASISRTGGVYTVVPAQDGRTIDLSVALERASAALDNLSAADTQVAVEATVLVPQVSTAQAQAAVDQANAVTEQALTLTADDTTATLAPEQLRGWVHLQDAGPGAWQLVISRDAIAAWVATVAKETDRPAKEASLEVHDGNVRAVPGQTGLVVDIDATTDAVYNHLLARADGQAPSPAVEMAMTVTTPEFTTEEAIAAAPRVEKVSEWTTRYVPGESNFFGGNIRVPTNVIDGAVVAPGGYFSFWGLMPPSLSELPGIGPGGIIKNGRTRTTGAIGGGICSCSTTLFNAVARAGLDIGHRRNHSYYISRYPVGLDATVWRTSSAQQDMSFTNDTEYPVLIRGINGKNWVRFEIWTVPTGRTVDFSKARVENKTQPKEYMEYTDSLAPGTQKRVEYPIAGFESWVTWTVRDASGNIIHREMFYSKYKTINGITLVGRHAGDPKDGTRVLRSEYRPSAPRPTPPDPAPSPSPTP
jgi:vancomycin resistance protein YoaR